MVVAAARTWQRRRGRRRRRRAAPRASHRWRGAGGGGKGRISAASVRAAPMSGPSSHAAAAAAGPPPPSLCMGARAAARVWRVLLAPRAAPPPPLGAPPPLPRAPSSRGRQSGVALGCWRWELGRLRTPSRRAAPRHGGRPRPPSSLRRPVMGARDTRRLSRLGPATPGGGRGEGGWRRGWGTTAHWTSFFSGGRVRGVRGGCAVGGAPHRPPPAPFLFPGCVWACCTHTRARGRVDTGGRP